MNGVNRNEWCRYLASCLTNKANRVLAGLTLAENQDFDLCKSAILCYYKLDATAYKKRFREARKSTEESYKMFKNRIHDYLLYYVDARAIASLDSMIDDVLSEQLMNVMADEVRQFVVSKQAKTAADCAEFADLYTEMNVNAGAGMAARKPQPGSGGQSAPGATGGGGQPRNNTNRANGGSGGGSGSGGNSGAGAAGTNAQYNALRGRCYNCQETGHKRAECPYGRGGEDLESVPDVICLILHVPFMLLLLRMIGVVMMMI